MSHKMYRCGACMSKFETRSTFSYYACCQSAGIFATINNYGFLLIHVQYSIDKPNALIFAADLYTCYHSTSKSTCHYSTAKCDYAQHACWTHGVALNYRDSVSGADNRVNRSNDDSSMKRRRNVYYM